ncbi:hypothetical protein PYW08_001700 [Mythimna loreyi]|uniref:Uncharacterized protein n=1 Tax=Mythimna loreyi TaxID=667449 RepID=A0ACC2R7C9_9NEOP|nr:hypothetical protein PYW08_001700 [Mythimna loreyi]
MRRTDRTPLPAKSALYCCEDHFDIETDMKDYKKYKMLGGKLRLKQGVVPHKFACQQMKKDIILIKLPVNKKQKQIELFEKALNTKIKPENITEVPVEFIKCEPIDKTETDSIGGPKIKCETTDTDEKNPVGGMKIKCEQIDIDETNPVGDQFYLNSRFIERRNDDEEKMAPAETSVTRIHYAKHNSKLRFKTVQQEKKMMAKTSK